MTPPIQNPALYRKLSEPFENKEAFDQALSEFTSELRALREKHKLPDVVYIISANVKNDAGEQTLVASGHCGSAAMVLPLLHQCFKLHAGSKMRQLAEMVGIKEEDDTE